MSGEPKHAAYTEEIMRQTAMQSALLAGFAFTALTAIEFDAESSQQLQIAFTIATSLAVALELIALFASGMLTFISKIKPLHGDGFDREFTIAWITYLLGLFAFVVALALLAWIKFQPAAIPVTVIAGVTALILIFVYAGIYRQASK
ncbi:MAG: hypothetical protein AAF585_15935 [Verrucomicrobiota bacterium]